VSTFENFLQTIGNHPWEATWTAIAVLFVLAIVTRMRANGAALAVLVAVIVVLAALLWVHQRPTVQASAPERASMVERASETRPQAAQASQARPSPYDQPVPESTGGVR
jgi:hypothetical protein